MTPLADVHDFYGPLPARAKADLDAVSTERRLADGATLFTTGALVNHLWQVRSGEVKVTAHTAGGREAVSVLIREGGWVGLSEVFTRLPAMGNVVAVGPVVARALHHADLRDASRRHPEIALELLRVMSLRCRLTYFQAMDLRLLPLKERVIKTLWTQALSLGCSAQDSDVLIALAQDELAKLLSVSRQVLNRTLKTLEREGLLQPAYGGVRLTHLGTIEARYGHLLSDGEPVPVQPAPRVKRVAQMSSK